MEVCVLVNRSVFITAAVVFIFSVLVGACGGTETPATSTEPAAPTVVATAAGTVAPTAQPAETEETSPTHAPEQPTATAEPTPSVAVNGSAPTAEVVVRLQGDEPLPTVQIVKVLRPSVVHIGTRSVAITMSTQDVPEGVGTGIILDDKGHILTNNHVVEGAQQMVVTLHNDESFLAELVGRDPQTDTAVIRIDAEGLVPAKLGVSAKGHVPSSGVRVRHPVDRGLCHCLR